MQRLAPSVHNFYNVGMGDVAENRDLQTIDHNIPHPRVHRNIKNASEMAEYCRILDGLDLCYLGLLMVHKCPSIDCPLFA